MKVGDVVQAKRGLEIAYGLKLKSGARAMKLRGIAKKANEVLSSFDEVRNGYIKATGKEEVKPTDGEWPELVARINEALDAEADCTIEAVIEATDLEGIEVSAADVDALVVAGLLKEETQ